MNLKPLTRPKEIYPAMPFSLYQDQKGFLTNVEEMPFLFFTYQSTTINCTKYAGPATYVWSEI